MIDTQPERIEFCEAIIDGLSDLCTTKNGMVVKCQILGYANAKNKKKVIKSLKLNVCTSINYPQVIAWCLNPINYLVILRLLSIVDDTKLIELRLINVRILAIYNPIGNRK